VIVYSGSILQNQIYILYSNAWHTIKKFRRYVIEYKDAEHTFKEVSEAFGVDSKRYCYWKKQLEETGSLEYSPPKERSGTLVRYEKDRLAR
jgi:transposase